jgi:MYXO-CTERM domain-containing protein
LSNPVIPRRFRAAMLSLLAIVLVAGSALAAGRVEWKSKSFKERSDKAWMLELKIFLPRAPDVAYVPVKFEFEPYTYFERALVDGQEGPVERKVPLEGKQPLIESVDVGFMDSGTSKIESRTRFSFKVKRDLGFEAGEYKVTLKDSRSGQKIGQTTTITFDGENEIIDRRAMVFSGEKKKKKEEPKKDDAAEKKSDEAASDSSESGEEKAAAAEGEASSEEGSENSGGDEPPAVEGKPGGCGCRVAGEGSSSPLASGSLIAALGLALGFGLRRSRRS